MATSLPSVLTSLLVFLLSNFKRLCFLWLVGVRGLEPVPASSKKAWYSVLFVFYKSIVASNFSFLKINYYFKSKTYLVRRSEYLRIDEDEVVPSDVTSEVTSGDVTSEVTSGDVTSRAGVSDVSSRGTDVNSDFEVCSSPQQGGDITYTKLFVKNSACVEKNNLFLTKFVASGRFVVAKRDIAVGEVILRNMNSSTSSHSFPFTKSYIMINFTSFLSVLY
jgi:hypothetical protein